MSVWRLMMKAYVTFEEATKKMSKAKFRTDKLPG